MRVTCRVSPLPLALTAAIVLTQAALAQELPFPRDHHPWGHFPVGSWKQVRTTTESLDDKGQVISVTITDARTTMVAADDSGYTLQTSSSVNVASQRIAGTPRTTRYGYYGETVGQTLDVKRATDASIDIDGRAIPCEVRQVSLSGDAGKLVSKLYYSSQCPPFVLRRETSLEGAADEKKSSSLVEVVALDLPQRVRGQLKQACFIKTTQNLPTTSKVTLEVHCDEVPGGVVAHWSSETDGPGRILRRSTLELLDYGLGGSSGQAPAVIRRPVRAGKAVRRMDGR